MTKRFFFLALFASFCFTTYAQMYILNQDFSGASGTTPPAGWTNITVTGGSADVWHYDNPGQQILNYPVTEPFAIFDGGAVSDNGQAEEVALETPVFDASISNFILLNFHHVFEPAAGAVAKVLAYDGSAWQQVASYSAATQNPESEIVDLSPVVGGKTNARLRFVWQGNGSGFWGIDNIRIYASQPLDGGIVAIDSPTSPVNPGVQQVKVSFGNFGYNTITSATIRWTANGVPQPDFPWTGSAAFGQTVSNIIIGTYDFQTPVLLKVWQTSPNGGNDPNPYNDTITKYVESALCGTYTIGGNNPDFASFSAAASTLNSAGITCPVTFLVRDGVYHEQFILRDIPGSSSTNTVTFRSESGDSTKAVIHIYEGALKYEPMIYMADAHDIRFENLGFSTGSTVSFANTGADLHSSYRIDFQGCYFESVNQFDFSVAISDGSHNIDIAQSRFECVHLRAGACTVSDASTREIGLTGNIIKGAADWGYVTVSIAAGASNIAILDNSMYGCFKAVSLTSTDSVLISGNNITNSNYGIFVSEGSTNTQIYSNRLTGMKSHQNVPDGTAAISVEGSTGFAIFNNFVQTTGEGIAFGITLRQSASAILHFNSVSTCNTDVQGRSSSLLMEECGYMQARNNILSVAESGIPISLDIPTPTLDFDHNDYYSFDGTIGLCNGTRYHSIADWSSAVGMDATSLSVIPFFTSDSDLSINQALLNNTAVPVAGIAFDIDGMPRDPSFPDYGAKEYQPCAADAGINAVTSPQNPLPGGVQTVTVTLQNQGTATLTTVQVNWTVNGLTQAAFPWSGSLVAGANTDIAIGSFDFQSGTLYTIQAWTSSPNGGTDCNHANDTIVSNRLAAPLCGTYTIGGTNPDFSTFNDAVSVLNLAGISCPVTFMIRDGLYREQLVLKDIPGTAGDDGVTFVSESGDSSLAVLQIPSAAQKFEVMLSLESSRNISFRGLGLYTGSNTGYNNYAVFLAGSENIRFENCWFKSVKESDMGLNVTAVSNGVFVDACRFESIDKRAQAIIISDDGTVNVSVTNCEILGAYDIGYTTVRIGYGASFIYLQDNLLQRCFRAVQVVGSDNVMISGNTFQSDNDGIYIDEFSSQVKVFANKMVQMNNHPDSPEGNSAVYAHNSTGVEIFNNFIHASGNGPFKGINVQNLTQGKVYFNSVNLANADFQAKSKAFYVKENTGLTAKNNIFFIKFAGTPVYLEGGNPQLDLDRNNYFSMNGAIGFYSGNSYSDLAAWKAATSQDPNSFSVNPFYSSDIELTVNQGRLNSAGQPIATVEVDIDGTFRDPVHPDLGAREFTPCAADAGVNDIAAPRNPLQGGAQEVRVILQNNGTATLTSAIIHWLVNDQFQTEVAWTGSLAAGSSEEVSLGAFDFQGGVIYSIQAWTTSPNNVADCNALNDLSARYNLSAPLCGTYTVGGQDADFESLSAAAAVLGVSGIACPVTILVRDGMYTDQLVIGEIPGSSPDNTVTFRSESGNAAAVQLHIDPLALKGDPLILLKGAKNISFFHLGFYTGSLVSNGNYGLLLSGAENIRLEGCYFESLNESDLGLVIKGGSKQIAMISGKMKCSDSRSGALDISESGTRGITISGNVIQGASTWGYTILKIGNFVQDVTLSDNTIEQCYRAVYAVGADSLFILGNTIRNVNEGIYIENQCSNVFIHANRLIGISSHQNAPDGTNGIMVQRSSGVEVVNNFVETTGTGPCKGITIQYADTCQVWYNSVNITNTDAQGKSKGIYLKEIGELKARDNIFSVKALGIPMEVDINVSTLSLDYNNYYQAAGTVGKINGVLFTSLSQWGQTVNGDANSKVVNPYFKADTIPLPFQRALNGAGIAIPGVTVDIEGKTRFSQAPDIGCLEFFVDYGILDLLSPSLECFHASPDSVIVYIRQWGDVPFNDLKVAYQMNGGPVHLDTIPGPHSEDVIHNFGLTEDLTTYGDYLFKVWLINTLDDNINNDTLYAWRYSKPSPEPSFTYDNFCTGPKVYFMGQSTVPAPYVIVGYEWLFGDGDTSTEQNPVHTYAGAGTYQVAFRAYSDAGCYGEIIQDVFVSPDFIPLTLDYSLNNETCLWAGDGSITVSISGGFPPVVLTMNGVAVENGNINGLTTGQYIFEATDSQNCTLLDTVYLASEVQMNPHILAEPVTGNSPLSVSFDFVAENTQDWLWHFSETETDTSRQPVYTFYDYGSHLVRLDVMSGPPYNCVETATIEIFVDVIVTIEANNVFTPNGDGVNDFFHIRTTGIKELDASIYNSWGNRVYRITDLDGLWDGSTEGGAKVPDGTYFWSLSAAGADGMTYERQGTVQLLRHAAEAVPNPARDQVMVNVYDDIEPPVELKIFSAVGTLVRSEVIPDASQIRTDLSGLECGLYFIRVTNGESQYFVRVVKY